jgi:hypothetical protein
MRGSERCFALATTEYVSAELARYANESHIARTAHFDVDRKCYAYETEGGVLIRCGGLIEALRVRFFAHVDLAADVRKKRRHTKIRGSSASVGKRIDSQLMHYVQSGALVARAHPWSVALVNHWQAMGHTLVAAQLPVCVKQWDKLTQADILTVDRASGRLWLWEVKSGAPVGGYRKNGTFSQAPFAGVPCTKYNQWQLQLYFTRKALEESARLPIAEARVIQIYGEKGKDEPVIKVHDPPSWIPRHIHQGPLPLLLLQSKKPKLGSE